MTFIHYSLFNGEPFDPTKFAGLRLYKWYSKQHVFKKNRDLTEIQSKLKILPVLNLDDDYFKLVNNPLKKKIKRDSAVPIKNMFLVLKDNDPGSSMSMNPPRLRASETSAQRSVTKPLSNPKTNSTHF